MERLIGWWVKNPVAANLLMVGLLLAGVLGFIAVEREAFPAFSMNRVQVDIVWPGAAPQEVEEQIIVRLEESISDLDGVRRVTATAAENFGQLVVFAYNHVDIDAFLNDVKNRIDAVNGLPRDIEKPLVRHMVQRSEMIRIAVYGELSERELTRLAEDMRDEVAALPHIAIVELFGTRSEEVTIELSEPSMRRYGVSFEEVAAAIRASSINLSSGELRTATGDVRLRARNLADTSDDFENIIVRETREGATVRVRDVARVIDGFEDNEILATINGQPSVLLQMMTTDNMQVVKASDAVREWIEQTRPGLPAGAKLSMWFDTADIYKSRMSTISGSAYLGLLLVFLVLILSLRPRVALWVTAGIAISFLGTFALLPVNGVSLNIMSTFAFLLVLGIVVDDAIVVGESVHSYSHQMGGGPDSAIAGANAVAKPVIFAVLTTIVAFAPWLFLDFDGGHMTQEFSIVITVALTISLVEAFFILPAHLRHLEPRHNLSGLALRQKRIEHSIIQFANTRYRGLLAWAADRRYLAVSLFLFAFTVSLGLFNAGWVKFTFFPEIQNEQIYINVLMPNGTPYSRALEVLDQLQDAELQLIDEVEQKARDRGGSGELIEGWYTRSRRDSVIAIIKLTPPERRDLSAREAALRLQQIVGDIPDADEITVNYTINDQGPALTYVLRHRDLELLRSASRELQTRLSSYDGTFYVRDSLQGETDELHMSLRPGAHKLGLSLAQVSMQVRQAYYGEEVQRLPRENGDVKVMVKYPRGARESLQSLENFRVRTADGRELPLLSVVDVEVARSVQRIQRRDGERMVSVTADSDPELMSDINKDVEDNFMPELKARYPDLVAVMGGQQETEQDFFNKIIPLYAVAFFVMYTLIAVAFRSYWLPLLIMTAIPFGFMGAVFGHLMFGVPMALFSYFGIGAAAGVVVNDNLVLVDYIGRLRDRGCDRFEAVTEAGVQRFRPILLTTVTTFVGLLPIMAERSTDAEFLKPAVLSLAFGVLFALLVTLLMVPALYLIGEDLRQGLSRIRQRLLPGGAPDRADPQ